MNVCFVKKGWHLACSILNYEVGLFKLFIYSLLVIFMLERYYTDNFIIKNK